MNLSNTVQENYRKCKEEVKRWVTEGEIVAWLRIGSRGENGEGRGKKR